MKIKAILKKYKVPILITIVMCGLYSLRFVDRSFSQFSDPLDHRLQNNLMAYHPTPPVYDQIAIAAIDSDSLNEFGRWPWERKEMARLLQTLQEYYRADVIGMTVMFPQADINDKEFQKTISEIKSAIRLETRRSSRLETVLNRFSRKVRNDTILSRTLANSPRLVSGYEFFLKPSEVNNSSPIIRKLRLRSIQASGIKIAPEYLKKPPLNQIPVALSALSNLAELNPYPQNAGFLNLFPEQNQGIVSHAPLLLSTASYLHPSFALQIVKMSKKAKSIRLSALPENFQIQLGAQDIFSDLTGQIRLHFPQSDVPFQLISVSEILNRTAPQELLRGKIVLVGGMVPQIFSQYQTPNDSEIPGVLLQGHIVGNLLAGSYLTHHPAVDLLVLLLMLILGGYLTYFLPNTNILKSGLISAGLLCGVVLISIWLFKIYHWDFSFVFPAFLIVFNWLGMAGCFFYQKQLEQQKLQQGLQNHIPEKDLETVMRDPTLLQSNQYIRDVTVIYSDLKNFSEVTRQLPADKSVPMLQHYLQEMTRIIREQEGTVVRYEGDAIVACWGAPLQQLQTAEKACRGAFEMQQKLLELNSEWKMKYQVELVSEIGISTGEVLIGDLEHADNLSFTMLGEPFDFARQLQQLCHLYQLSVLTDRTTYQNVKKIINSREIDFIQQKNMARRFKIYQPLFPRDGQPNAKIKGYNYYLKGLKLYRERKWDQAIQNFKQADKILQNDPPSQLLSERCSAYQKTPPASDWKGEYPMNH